MPFQLLRDKWGFNHEEQSIVGRASTSDLRKHWKMGVVKVVGRPVSHHLKQFFI